MSCLTGASSCREGLYACVIVILSAAEMVVSSNKINILDSLFLYSVSFVLPELLAHFIGTLSPDSSVLMLILLWLPT